MSFAYEWFRHERLTIAARPGWPAECGPAGPPTAPRTVHQGAREELGWLLARTRPAWTAAGSTS